MTDITPTEYREESLRRSPVDGTWRDRATLYSMGLGGESGEVLDEVKKILFHGRSIDRDKILEELGDVLWYLDRMLYLMGFTLEACMFANMEKLRERYPDGFKLEADR